MACSNLTGGFTLDCNDANGGIDKIFIANGPVESITETAGTITAITVGGSALTPSDFFEFLVNSEYPFLAKQLWLSIFLNLLLAYYP